MRLATYNMLHGIDIRDGRVDLEAVAGTVAELRCDAVALQEVDRGLPRTGLTDQVAWLAARLGWHGVFAPALLGDPDRHWETVPDDDTGGPAYGVGLLARFALLQVRRVALPGGGRGSRPVRPQTDKPPGWPGWDREPRVALVADVDAGDRTVRLVTTHLSYLPWRGLAQLRAAMRLADGRAGVLLGDLNLPVWTVRRALGPAWHHPGGGPTYPSWEPRMQPDQVAVTGGLSVSGVEVGAPGSSDHRPLVATVAL